MFLEGLLPAFDEMGKLLEVANICRDLKLKHPEQEFEQLLIYFYGGL
jgi:hypothetical protein